jgi:hypothetical protein
MFLKLVSLIFPTSDFKHRIMTPSFITMTRYLRQVSHDQLNSFFKHVKTIFCFFVKCSIDSLQDVLGGIFLTNLCFEVILKKSKK